MTVTPIRVNGFLVVDASGNLRALKTMPRLKMDEVAFPITVSIPRTWGRVQSTSIDVQLPEPPEARVTVGDPDLAPDEPAEEVPT
jgi:hypothetical protein